MRKIVLTIFQIFWSLAIISQTTPTNPKLFNFDTPSPEIANLGKYGNTPVSYYAGLVNINVPIYTLKYHNLQVPISLNYHPSGIKVEEDATWVGLGWDLSAGGAIYRALRGADDFGAFGYYNGKGGLNVDVLPAYPCTFGSCMEDMAEVVGKGGAKGDWPPYSFQWLGADGKNLYIQQPGSNSIYYGG